MSSHNANPYAAPQSPTPDSLPPSQYSTKPKFPFEPATTWATMSSVMLGITILIDLGVVGSSLYQLGLIGRLQRNLPISEAEATTGQALIFLLVSSNLLALVVTSIAFCIWFHHAHRNLPSLRPYGKLEFSPGWAAGSFFVPILNLFRPYQIMQEVWNHSHPQQLDRHKKIGSTLAGWWWGGWIAGNILGNVVARVGGMGAGENLDDMSLANGLGILRAAIHIASAVALMLLIWRIDSHQTERYALVLANPKASPSLGPKNPWADQPPPAAPAPPTWGQRFGD